jgi:hypothetical protein
MEHDDAPVEFGARVFRALVSHEFRLLCMTFLIELFTVTCSAITICFRVGRYQKFLPRYVSRKNIAIFDISRYYFLANSRQKILGNNWIFNAFVTVTIGLR